MANEFKIKNGLISDGDVVVTGSITATGGINISGSIASAQTASFAPSYTLTSSFNSYTSSASSSVGELSGSVASTTSNLSSSIGSLSSSVATTTLNLSSSLSSSISSLSGSVATTTSNLSSSIGSLSSSVATTTLELSSSVATTTSGLAGRITTIEGRGATTGSNTFIGTQTITGSLFISSNLIVQGSSSLENITASAVNIGSNIINLNTANPAIRFAGLNIFDSGSIGGSGSFLYDSVQDELIFVHRGDNANITSSVILMGSQTYNNIGNEIYPTANRILKGAGNEHVGDSCIIDDGTTVTINANLNGSGAVCFASGVCTPSLVVNKSNPVLYINAGNNETSTIGFTQGAVAGYGGFIKVNTGLGDRSMTFGLSAAGTNNDASEVIRIDDSGVTCFSGTVCTPNILSSGTICSTSNICTGGSTVIAGCLGIGTLPTQSGTRLQVAGVTDIWSSANTLLRLQHDGTRGVIETFTGGAYSNAAINPNGGNVGIGTTSINAKLEVSSTDLNSIFVTNPTTTGTTTGSGIGFKAYNGTSVTQFGGIFLTSNSWSFGTYSTNQLSVGADGTGGLALRSANSAPITFFTGGASAGVSTERFRITSTGVACFACQVCAPVAIFSGCVGIGTISPSGKLEIRGNQSDTKDALLNLSKFDYGASVFYQNYSNTFFTNGKSLEIEIDSLPMMQLAINNVANQGRVIFPNGNVGIGTVNPTRQLEVYTCSTDRGGFIRSSNCATAGIVASYFEMFIGGCAMSIPTWRNAGILEAVTTCGMVLSAFCNNIAFQVGNRSEVMRITTSRVGIGTATPCSALEVFSRAADADRTIPHNVLTITAEQGNAPYGFFGGSILFKNRSYTSGMVESARIRSVIYDDGAPANCGGGLWFETTATPGGVLTPSLRIDYQGKVGIGNFGIFGPVSDLEIRNCNATIYDPTSDSGQDGSGVTLTIRNNDTSCVGSFSQINMQVSGDSGRALGRITTIRMGSATSDMAFLTENANTKAEKMRITASGNIGIGTSCPIASLHICAPDGHLRLSGDGRAQMILGTSTKSWQFETSCGTGNVQAGAIGIVEAGSGARFQILSGGISCFSNTVCSPVFRASDRIISNQVQIFNSDFSISPGAGRSVVICGGILTTGDFHLMMYGNAGSGMGSIRFSSYGYFANTSLLGFCEHLRYTFGSAAISGISNNGTSLSFTIANCSGSHVITGNWRMISTVSDDANQCVRVFIL